MNQTLDAEVVLEWIRPVEDPEMKMSLVDLGLIYKVKCDEPSKVEVTMTLTTPTCPAADYIVQQVQNRLLEHDEIEEARVQLVFEPKWDPRTMASDEAKEKLRIW